MSFTFGCDYMLHNYEIINIFRLFNMQSLCGHTSPVESVAFDSAEVLVLAGASAGVIKQWDLEEAKSMLVNTKSLVKIGLLVSKNPFYLLFLFKETYYA